MLLEESREFEVVGDGVHMWSWRHALQWQRVLDNMSRDCDLVCEAESADWVEKCGACPERQIERGGGIVVDVFVLMRSE